MKFFVDVVKVAVGNVGVDLGGADVGMAKQGLDRADIGAVREKVSGEAVSYYMRSDLLGNTCFDSIVFDDPSY